MWRERRWKGSFRGFEDYGMRNEKIKEEESKRGGMRWAKK
jgi:hypothetical protein